MMTRIAFFTWFLLTTGLSFGQLIQIKGWAPGYIGEEVSLIRYQDYITFTEEKLAGASVGKDSLFRLNFFGTQTERVKLKVGKNYAFLYIQPEGNYELYFPTANKYDPTHPEGSEMELLFRSLPKTDINYKILEFDRWLNEFLGEYYHLKGSKQGEFAKRFETLKMDMEKYYGADTSSFFKVFIKFRLAEIDEASFYGSRNEMERFDHYLLHSEVYYHNDAYMDYMKKFFKDFFERTTMELNNRIYQAILKSSPTRLFNALGADYRMKNLRVRELIMIKSLGELYYNPDYPQTNISVILDSLSGHALFQSNQVIASNLRRKLTDLVPGSPAPRFVLMDEKNNEISLKTFPGKYKYIQFVQAGSVIGKNEMDLMVPLNSKYGSNVAFITVLFGNDAPIAEYKKNYTWNFTRPKNEDDLKNLFHVRTFPEYVLIDPDGFIVASPALRPSPDGKYETIDRTLFEIHKAMMQIRD
jgi:hypothetical protein